MRYFSSMTSSRSTVKKSKEQQCLSPSLSFSPSLSLFLPLCRPCRRWATTRYFSSMTSSHSTVFSGAGWTSRSPQTTPSSFTWQKSPSLRNTVSIVCVVGVGCENPTYSTPWYHTHNLTLYTEVDAHVGYISAIVVSLVRVCV